MGLDASVYCDCWEKGKVDSPPVDPAFIGVDEAGCVELQSPHRDETDAQFYAFDAWAVSACKHPSFVLEHRRLGNIATIGVIRHILTRISEDPAGELPVLWSKVVYNGIHGGDYLKRDQVRQLECEINSIRGKQIPADIAPAAHVQKNSRSLWLKLFAVFRVAGDEPYTYELYRDCWMQFLNDMDALIAASNAVDKPIVF